MYFNGKLCEGPPYGSVQPRLWKIPTWWLNRAHLWKQYNNRSGKSGTLCDLLEMLRFSCLLDSAHHFIWFANIKVCAYSRGLEQETVDDLPGFCCLDAPYENTDWGEAVSVYNHSTFAILCALLMHAICHSIRASSMRTRQMDRPEQCRNPRLTAQEEVLCLQDSIKKHATFTRGHGALTREIASNYHNASTTSSLK